MILCAPAFNLRTDPHFYFINYLTDNIRGMAGFSDIHVPFYKLYILTSKF